MAATATTAHRASMTGRRDRSGRATWALHCSCGHVERYDSVHDVAWARAAMRAHQRNARDAAGTRY